MAELLTIGEVARRSGVAASALRYYEDRGLITSERTGAAHRRYPRAVKIKMSNYPRKRPRRRSIRAK